MCVRARDRRQRCLASRRVKFSLLKVRVMGRAEVSPDALHASPERPSQFFFVFFIKIFMMTPLTVRVQFAR